MSHVRKHTVTIDLHVDPHEKVPLPLCTHKFPLCLYCVSNTVEPRYMFLIRSRSLDLYQKGCIPNKFFQ